MPVTLKFTFPAGRYHATPWGRHVNEGVTEWPPSPWRLLRALVATWRRKCSDLTETAVQRVLEQLLPPPRFHLPAARVAHTRHYMPLNTKSVRDVKGGGTTLVFDTFVAVGRKDPVLVDWPDATLSPEEQRTLARLAENLTTLGRAEAWVQAELASSVTSEWNCGPSAVTATDQELVPVFCPDPATAFGNDYYPLPPDPKRLKKGLKPDEYLFDCPRWHLCLDTEIIHDKRWPRVPGARWVSYARGTDAFTKTAPRPPVQPARRDVPTVARFLLDGPVLPLVSATLPLAEDAREELLRRFRQGARGRGEAGMPAPHSKVFSGKDGPAPHGKPLQNHRHAYYLPADEDGDGHIDHLTVYAEQGFNADEIAALDRLRNLARAGTEALRLQLIGLGRPEDFNAPLLCRAKVWVSVTPFIASRGVKKRGRKKDAAEFRHPEMRVAFAQLVLEEELRRLAGRREGLPQPAIEPLKENCIGPLQLRPLQFKRFRRTGSDEGGYRSSGGFRLVFPEAVSGPICVGHSCHFGMGLFLPQKSPQTNQ